MYLYETGSFHKSHQLDWDNDAPVMTKTGIFSKYFRDSILFNILIFRHVTSLLDVEYVTCRRF